MSISENPNLIALVGTAQQKTAMVVYNKQIARHSSHTGTPRHVGPSPVVTDQQGQDTTTISRPAIAALENAQIISDESIIRGDDLSPDTLDYSLRQILENTQKALSAHSNQVSGQLLRDLQQP